MLYVVNAKTPAGKIDRFKFKSNMFAFGKARDIAKTSQYAQICVVEYLKNRAWENEINKVFHVK